MSNPRMPKLRPTIVDPALDRVLDDLLNKKVEVGPGFYDFLARWKEAPAKEFDRKYPWELTRPQLQLRFIKLAEILPEANEALRSLVRHLEEHGELTSPALTGWAIHRGVWGDPAPRRGRPPAVEDVSQTLKAYWLLRDLKRTREEAISVIAEKMEVPDETIRSTVRKYGKTHPIPVEMRPFFSP